MWRKVILSLLVAVIVTPLMTVQAATTLPTGFAEWELSIPGGSPTAMEFAPDGRLFVLTQGGTVWVVKNGSALPTPFITLTVDDYFERGLLGIAFDPNFRVNHYLYLYYTTVGTSSDPTHNRLSRFTANGDVVVPGSEVHILNLPNLSAGNHNGGAIHFGTDNKLYVAVGDNANGANAQNMDTRLGKMLRINTDGSNPSDNPFYSDPAVTGANKAIWATGLRNPYTFDVDRTDGTIYINDVGQNTWEEINPGAAGANYGWPETEGDFDQGDYPDYTRPLYAYAHPGGNCAITGGAFYQPLTAQFPTSYEGRYFFADYCGDWIQVYDPATDSVAPFASSTAGSVVDLKVAPDGSLYYLSRSTGNVHVIQYVHNQPPYFSQQPEDLMVAVGDPASFTCDSSDASATYQWQRDDGSGFADIVSATSKTYTLDPTALSDDGALFHCIATNGYGSRTSRDAMLRVVTNLPPVVTITAPSPTALYRAGTKIKFSGKATDPEDGALPASAFTWKIDFYHNDGAVHFHPAMPETTGIRSGKFTIPNMGETSPNVWYRITLTATDSDGNSTEVARDVYPRLSTMTFQTDPPNLEYSLDGAPQTAPLAVQGVAGILRHLDAPLHQAADGTIWQFAKWQPGGKNSTDIKTPTRNTTYTARYIERQVANGSFEINKRSRPTKWKLSKFTSLDIADCTIAADLGCSLHITGGSNLKTAAQTISLVGLAGDSYTLDFSSQGLNASTDGFTVQLIMFYKDRTSEIASVDLTPGSGWSPDSLTVTATKPYSKLQVKIMANAGASGEGWFDAFHLSLN